MKKITAGYYPQKDGTKKELDEKDATIWQRATGIIIIIMI